MSRCVLVGVVLFVVFKFSDVKSLLVGDGDESVIFTADGVVDVVFSDVDRVDGVDGESAVFDFDLYVKGLGRSIGGVVDPASVDGDGDGMRTGRDGKDNVPALKKPKKTRQRLLNADDRPPSAPTDPMPGESRDARGFDADPEEESYWKRRNANAGVDRNARNVGGNEGVDESARLREQDRVRGENEARLKRDNEIRSLQARVVADTEELNRGASGRVSPEATEKITNALKENRKRLSELLIEREEANKAKEKLSESVLPVALKILGKPIGGASEVDGDGDLMTTGPDGKDNVPVVPVAAVARSGSGAKFLDAIDKQQAVLEKEFGDLSDRKNAKAAFEKTFPNLRNFDLFEEGDEPLSVLQVGQVVAFLSLGKDKRVADSLTAFEELTDLNGGGKGGFGQCQVGIDFDKHPTGLGHALLMRNAPHAGGHGIKGWTGIAWADDVVLKMRQEGASVDDIDRFFGFAVATHEWSHAEHNVASFEFLGVNVEDDAPTYLRKIHIAMGGEGKKFDEDFGALVERQKEKGFSDEEAIIRAIGALTGNDKNWKKVTNFMEKGLEDDLDASDLSNLGPAFSAMTSRYAAKNLQELVAEKNSAIKMGHPSGPSNPAWRKLAAFVSGGVKAEQEIANLTRQQRRALERQKKKSLKQDIEKNSVLIYHSCTGYGAQDDQKSESSKDALSGVVTASDDDLDWFPYSHPIEGFDGVLEHSEKGEVLRDPKGGLTAAGRRHFRETEGSNLLPGVRGRADTPKKMRRKGSFLTRFFTNPSGPMKDENGKPTRLALSAAAWGEPVPQNMEDAAELAAKGRRLLERYANSKKKSADGDNL